MPCSEEPISGNNLRVRTARPGVEHATEGIFLQKKNPAGVLPLSFLQSFFSKKRRSSRDIEAARRFIFFAKLSFLQKKAGLRGGTLRFPPLKLPTLKGLPVTVAGHWVLPLSYCACAPGASAVGTLSGRSRLIARPPLILATFVASALLACKCSQSSFACGLRARTLAVLAPVR